MTSALRREEGSNRAFEREGLNGITVWLDFALGAPSEKFVRVDLDPNYQFAATLPVALIALSGLAPPVILEGETPWIEYDLANSRIFLWPKPRDRMSMDRV